MAWSGSRRGRRQGAAGDRRDVRSHVRADGSRFRRHRRSTSTTTRCRATLEACLGADAVLLGAIGGPKWSAPNAKLRPETGLLPPAQRAGRLREPASGARAAGADRFLDDQAGGARWRGPRVHPRAYRRHLFRREAPHADDGGRRVRLQRRRSRARCARRRAPARQQRRKKVTSIDKSNVLETSRLWREVADRVMKTEFPDVQFEHIPGRCGGDAPHPPAARFRRAGHREHVRRHPHGRSLDAGELAGHAALGLAGRFEARPVRADPRPPRRTSPARASRIPTARSSASRCCCVTPGSLAKEADAARRRRDSRHGKLARAQADIATEQRQALYDARGW